MGDQILDAQGKNDWSEAEAAFRFLAFYSGALHGWSAQMQKYLQTYCETAGIALKAQETEST